MIENQNRFDGADERVIDYSDPAQIPHRAKQRYRRNDSGGFVAAGIAVGMVLVGGFIYAGYLTEGLSIMPHHFAQEAATPTTANETASQK